GLRRLLLLFVGRDDESSRGSIMPSLAAGLRRRRETPAAPWRRATLLGSATNQSISLACIVNPTPFHTRLLLALLLALPFTATAQSDPRRSWRRSSPSSNAAWPTGASPDCR